MFASRRFVSAVPMMAALVPRRITARRLVASPAASTAAAAASSSNAAAAASLDVNAIAKKLESDPDLLRSVLNALTPEARRKLVIAGGALEWFGKDHISEEVVKADLDKDKHISPKDFDKWFETALRRRAAAQGSAATSPGNDAATAAAASSTTEPSASATAASAAASKIPLGVLFLLAIESGLPFVGFGFLDNASMILAGDAIDRYVGAYFSLSVMATAAMGNIVAGCMGMQVHGFVEKLVHLLKLPVPSLTEGQRRSNRVFMAEHLGGTFGIALGLCLGMLPLLFLEDETDKADKKAFQLLDQNGDGFIGAVELHGALTEIGFPITLEVAETKLKKFSDGNDKGLSWKGFQALVRAEREHHSAPHVVATKSH